MHSVGYGHSDVGRAREQNEDAMRVDDGLGLYVVCDGMGGHAAGEVASATAIDVVAAELHAAREPLLRFRREGGDPDAITAIVRDAVAKASRSVFELAQSAPERAGMGCTLTLLLVLGTKAAIAHVGDSRLYLVRRGKTSQLTNDHSMANELCLAGLISAEEVKEHPYAHVLTRAIGTQPHVVADLLMMDVVPGDRFLLCSDGLADYLGPDASLGEKIDGRALPDVPGELIAFANESGGHDNVTVIAVRVEADDPEIEIVDEMSSEVLGKFDALGSVFLFEGLSMALLTRVLNACEVRSYAIGEVVLRRGDRCEALWIVLDGLFSLDEGEQPRDLGPGDHVGAAALLAPEPARGTLAAKGAGRLLVLRREPFWALIRQKPWLGVGLLDRLSRKMADRSSA